LVGCDVLGVIPVDAPFVESHVTWRVLGIYKRLLCFPPSLFSIEFLSRYSLNSTNMRLSILVAMIATSTTALAAQDMARTPPVVCGHISKTNTNTIDLSIHSTCMGFGNDGGAKDFVVVKGCHCIFYW
jgi:hypothetical protein